MHKVVTINLNGRAYQLDEPAFDLLRRYLDQAETSLKGNPDRAEILADLEQAIAEKCSRFLSAHKTVLSASELEQVITQMGPVEVADADSGDKEAAAPPGGETTHDERSGPKRFYRIRDGQMFAGVCNGAAAYFNVDVVFVRIAVVLLAIVTQGWALLGYVLLAFAVPEARTADEHAAAHGQAPFNAQDVIDEAKRTAASFTETANATGREWRRQMQVQRRHWRSQARAWRRQWRAGMAPPQRPATVLWPAFGLLSLAGVAVLVLALLALTRVEDIHLGIIRLDPPVIATILVIALVFHIVTAPMRAARYAAVSGWGYRSGWSAVMQGLFGTVLALFGLWLLLSHMPPVHDFGDLVQGLPEAIRGAAREVAGWFREVADAIRDRG